MRTFSTILCTLCFTFCAIDISAQEIQTVRIDFQNPDGFTRHLALGFVSDNSATDGVDYGYDALSIEDLQDDLNWMIEGQRFIIQGVGAYDPSKYYPLGMFLINTGDISISLNTLENFENDIDVYLYDAFLDTYTLLNSSDFDISLTADTYLDRFYITFSTTAHIEIANDNLLSIDEDKLKRVKIWHSKSNQILQISGISDIDNTVIYLYSMEGREVLKAEFSNKDIELDTSGLSNGLYLVGIESPTISQSIKVCIAN